MKTPSSLQRSYQNDPAIETLDLVYSSPSQATADRAAANKIRSPNTFRCPSDSSDDDDNSSHDDQDHYSLVDGATSSQTTIPLAASPDKRNLEIRQKVLSGLERYSLDMKTHLESSKSRAEQWLQEERKALESLARKREKMIQNVNSDADSLRETFLNDLERHINSGVTALQEKVARIQIEEKERKQKEEQKQEEQSKQEEQEKQEENKKLEDVTKNNLKLERARIEKEQYERLLQREREKIAARKKEQASSSKIVLADYVIEGKRMIKECKASANANVVLCI